MKRVVYKVFFAWQAEKEEKWLNEMAQSGWALVGVGFFRYVFVKGEPGEYAYRIELLENTPTNQKSLAYLDFLRETGIETVGSILRWVYLRKKAQLGAFELYSDLHSKLAYHKRLRAFFLTLVFAELSIGLSNLTLAFSTLNRIQTVNLTCAIVLFALAVMLAFAAKKHTEQIKYLQKEREIRE